jgi:hypothetical protein
MKEKNACAALLRTLTLLGGLALVGISASAGTTGANPHRLDDSRSQTVPENAQMQWLPQSRVAQNAGMQATVRVNIYIDTTAWKDRTGQVYMVLPQDQNGAEIEAQWTTNGSLLPGRLVSGERTLVYAGRISGEALQDQMQVRLRSGPDWLSQNRRLNFYFEIDVDDQANVLKK